MQKGIELGIDVGVDYSSPPKARPHTPSPHGNQGFLAATEAASALQSAPQHTASLTENTAAAGHDDELPAFHPGFSRQHVAPNDIEALTGDGGHVVVMYPLKRHGRSLVGESWWLDGCRESDVPHLLYNHRCGLMCNRDRVQSHLWDP
jgi:hypothetical protein